MARVVNSPNRSSALLLRLCRAGSIPGFSNSTVEFGIKFIFGSAHLSIFPWRRIFVTTNPVARSRSGPTSETVIKNLQLICALLGLSLLGSGCSIKRMAVNRMGDALAASGTTFASDDDPELVKAAVPFSLKLMESLLAESPVHEGLLRAASSGFTQYSYAFVQQDADELEDTDFAAAQEMRARARRLYLRAQNYGLRGLDTRHDGFQAELRANPKQAVARLRKKDVPTAYWTAASWAAAISLSKDDPEMIADLPLVEALIDRSLELDESFDHGAIHTFLITYEMARQGAPGEAAERAQKHFQRAMELSEGKLAGPLVSYAESVMVQKQDQEQFTALLEQALAINPDEHVEFRLANLIMQRRARWLLSRTDELFL